MNILNNTKDVTLSKIITKVISQSFLKIEQKKLAKILINKNIKFICLAGFMKILSPYFLNFFRFSA